MSNSAISKTTLKKLAGQAAFERGLDYFEDSSVVQWDKKRSRIIGIVRGNQDYSVTLELSKQGLTGYCDCPASDGIDFCKHCVALALQYQHDSEKQEKLVKGNSNERIQAYLESFSKETLAQHLLQIIQDDKDLQQQWSITADVALGKVDTKNLKKRITSAFPLNKNLYRYPQVRAYFARAEPIIDLLEQQIPGLPADKALDLVDYALERMHKALDTIDDSGGFRLTAQDTLVNLHFDLLERITWSKTQLAEYLLAVFDLPHYELMPLIPDAYEELLEEEGMEHFISLIQSRWDKLPELKLGASWQEKHPYQRLQSILLQQAEDEGDLETEIKLLEKTATEQRNFQEICELCLEYSEWDRAQTWLNKAKAFKTDERAYFKNHNLDRLQIKIHLHKKEKPKAVAILWTIFKDSPSLDIYKEMKGIGDKSQSKAFYEQVRGFLKATIAEKDSSYFKPVFSRVLFEVYLHENELEQALDMLRTGFFNRELCLNLARRLKHQFNDSFPIYQKIIHDSVQQANNDAYRKAVNLIQELRKDHPQGKNKTQIEAFVMALQKTFKAKRNFIKYLNEATVSS